SRAAITVQHSDLDSYLGAMNLITTTELQSLNHKSLTAMARDFEIAGRSSMTKDALIAAIRQAQESSRNQDSPNKPAEASSTQTGKSDERPRKEQTKQRETAAKKPPQSR